MSDERLRARVQRIVSEAMADMFFDLEYLGADPKEIEAALWFCFPFRLHQMWSGRVQDED